MSDPILGLDTQAILLLCGSLGQDRGDFPQPLTSREFNEVAKWLDSQSLSPAELMHKEIYARFEEIGPKKIESRRLRALLNRGAALALDVESWMNKGLWVISQYDKDYPPRWKTRLGNTAPSLIYGAGNRDILSKGGLAVVGSRDVDANGIAVARKAASLCSHRKIQIISGGARGVDREAMTSALSEGGYVVGVLADSLARSAVSSRYRQYLRAGTLILVSPYDPRASFNVGNAMSRNRLVYCLSDWALVVSSAFMKGGTWAGAIENLKQKWVPIFVYEGEGIPDGNRRLIEEGAIGIKNTSLSDENTFMEFLENNSFSFSRTEIQIDLKNENIINLECPPKKADDLERTISTKAVEPKMTLDLFPKVWPFIEAELHSARTEKELAEIFNVQPMQMRAWLNQAVTCRIVRKLKRPTRYIAQKDQLLLQKWVDHGT